MRKRTAFAWTLWLIAAAGHTEALEEVPDATEVQTLSTFEENAEGWQYYGGWEFKGAKGSVARDETEAASGRASLRVRGDFSEGGSYVAARKAIRRDALEFRFRLKAPGFRSLDLRLVDRYGQTFQYHRVLDGRPDWQTISLRDFSQAAGHWGGRNDGRWYPPSKELWVMLSRSGLPQGAIAGDFWLDDVEVVVRRRTMLPPLPVPPAPPPPRDSLFGFSGHMIHTDFFYGADRFDAYWGLEYTLPHLVEGGFAWMREGLYQGFFTGTNTEKVLRHRAKVDEYLSLYDRAGIRVMLCPLFSTVRNPHLATFFEWIGDLAARHPCVAGVEMHNEPNLKFFWGGTAQDYADSCRAAASVLRRRAPGTPIIVGSVSHLWWGPGVRWLQEALRAGALEVADAISVHPYRQGSPPEGGAMREAADDPDGFFKEVRDWYAMIRRFNPERPAPGVYFTEVGYSSGTGKAGLGGETQAIGVGLERQADYISRLALTVFDMRVRGLPIEGLFWYDLKCDGEDPLDMEANFGVLSYDAQDRRPAFHAYSRVARAFGATSDFIPLDLAVSFPGFSGRVKALAFRRLSDGATLIAFWSLDETTGRSHGVTATLEAVWLADEPDPVAVRLHDLRTEKPRTVPFEAGQGRLRVPVELSGRAAWIEALPRELSQPPTATIPWALAQPARFDLAGGSRVRVEAPVRMYREEHMICEFIIENLAASGRLPGRVVTGVQSLRFDVEPGTTQRLKISWPPVWTGDAAVAWYLVETNGVPVARGGLFTLLDSSLLIGEGPRMKADGRMTVRVKEASGRPCVVERVEWASGDRGGVLRPALRIEGGAEANLELSGPEPVPYREDPLRLRIEAEDRAPVGWEGLIGYHPCHRISGPRVDGDLSEWEPRPSIRLAEHGRVVMEGYGGTNDLDGEVWIGWNEEGFCLAARIRDDRFHQSLRGSTVWQGDGLQFALSKTPSATEGGWHEFGLSLTPRGPELWRWMGGREGTVPTARVAVKRAGGCTFYECALPWSELSSVGPAVADAAFAFSVLVNDNDGTRRKGWIEWGSGIGKNKDPSLFRVCSFSGD